MIMALILNTTFKLIFSAPQITEDPAKAPRNPGVSTSSEAFESSQAEALLQLPIDPSLTPNRAGTTPLMMASGGGYVDIVQLLLEAGASIDHRNRYGHTALMDSARFGHVPVVQLLLGAGAQKELRDVAGLTALMMAADGGHAQAVRLLLEAGAAKDVRNLAGQTALMMTSEPEVRLLLKPIRLDSEEHYG